LSNQKKCSLCAETKPIKAFYRRTDNTVEPICRRCRTSEERRNGNASPRAFLRVIVNKARYGAKKRNLSFTIDIDDVMRIYERQKGLCALSGIRMTYNRDGKGRKDMNVSLDRIEQDGGYTTKPPNVQLVCLRVNIMKHTLPEYEFFWWVKNIIDNIEK